MSSSLFSRTSFPNRTSWIEGRKNSIGASDAAAVFNDFPVQWKKNAGTLFDELRGRTERDDISSKPGVIHGVLAEEPVRNLAMLDLPYFSLEYHQFDILKSLANPFMTATLDGELTVNTEFNPWGFEVGTKGILECKTGSFSRDEAFREEWEDSLFGIPLYYLDQAYHQLAVTGYEFVLFAARVRKTFNTEIKGIPEIKNFYRIVDVRVPGVKENIMALIEEERAFWNKVQRGERPSVPIKEF